MPKSRLLVLASYPEMAAATRFRASAYFPALRASGIEPELHPFVDDAFMRGFYRPGGAVKKALGLSRFAIRRLALLARAGRFDAVFVQREAAMVGPAIMELLLAERWDIPLVFDFDDAIWMEHTEGSRHPLAAKLLRQPRKVIDVMRSSAHVIAGNHFLADFASDHASNVTVLPTVVPASKWTPLPGRMDGAFTDGHDVPVIGWIGTHTTAAQLDLVVPALRALAREGLAFRVRLVGASRSLDIEGVEVESCPWTLESEVRDFQTADVGIAPMHDDNWSNGKCGFKQIQYMSVGVPMVSSPGGGAREFMEHNVHGLFATNTDEWTAHLRALLTDAALRKRFANAGRALVEDRLSLEKQAPVMVNVIERVIERVPHRRAATHWEPATSTPARTDERAPASTQGNTMNNVDAKTVRGFGDEWSRFDQGAFNGEQRRVAFEQYFRVFPWSDLPEGAVGCDFGCGSGRWAACVAPRVGKLVVLDASREALDVARNNLADQPNVEFLHASVSDNTIPDGSLDFAYSLGVLHHVPDTERAMRSIREKLKPGAPFLVYLYYAFDNRPAWYRSLWQASDVGRQFISSLPLGPRYLVSQALAATVYWPLARSAEVLDRMGALPASWPLAYYKDFSFYTMRTDALDRFGTRLEKRFDRKQITAMLTHAGFGDIQFSPEAPFWVACARRLP